MKTMRSHSLSTLAVATLLAVPLCADTVPQTPTPIPTFRTGTRLVEMSVTVTDRNGSPVTDLTQADFEIQDKGQPREVAFFRYEGAPQTLNGKPLPPGYFTNRTDSLTGQPRNVVAIVMDSLNTAPEDQAFARAQVVRYLRTLALETRIAVFNLGAKLSIIHDFTDDAESLRRHFERLALSVPSKMEIDRERLIAEADAVLSSLERDPVTQEFALKMLYSQAAASTFAMDTRIRTTISSIEALARHLSGIPGRKSVIWVSGGISMMTMSFRNITSFEEQVRDAARRLADANVAMYITEARGLRGASTIDASLGRFSGPRANFIPREADVNTLSGDTYSALSTMANVTGGRFLRNTNNMLQGLDAATSDLRSAYTVAFYAPEEPDKQWHKVDVKANRPGTKVRHREGYFPKSSASDVHVWTTDTWRSAITNPLGSSSVQLIARCVPVPGDESGKLFLVVSVDPASIHFSKIDGRFKGGIEINTTDRTADGISTPHFESEALDFDAQQLTAIRKKGMYFQREWTPAPNTVSIRVIVRDASTGLYGTLDLPMKQVLAGAAGRKP